MLELL
jgi:hypothetical protein